MTDKWITDAIARKDLMALETALWEAGCSDSRAPQESACLTDDQADRVRKFLDEEYDFFGE